MKFVLLVSTLVFGLPMPQDGSEAVSSVDGGIPVPVEPVAQVVVEPTADAPVVEEAGEAEEVAEVADEEIPAGAVIGKRDESYLTEDDEADIEDGLAKRAADEDLVEIDEDEAADLEDQENEV